MFNVIIPLHCAEHCTYDETKCGHGSGRKQQRALQWRRLYSNRDLLSIISYKGMYVYIIKSTGKADDPYEI